MVTRVQGATRLGALLLCGGLALSSACKRSETAEDTTQSSAPGDTSEVASAGDDAAASAGDDAAPETADAKEARTITAPFLWDVTAPDGEPAGHLFGTMHMGIDAEASLPEVVWERLEDADTFVMEADVSDMSVGQQLMRGDGSTLKGEIGEEAWDQLVSIVGSFQARGLDRMKAPAAAMAVISAPMPSTVPMDLAILQRAEAAEVEVAYLEEASAQVELLMRYVTTDVLLHLLEDYEQVVEMSEKGLEAYYEGDADSMNEFMLDPANWAESPKGAKQALLDDRNEAWVPQLLELAADGEVFVAVGAGHLIGEGSVVDLLEAEGYDVRRVEAD